MTDPRFGAVCWPIVAVVGCYRDWLLVAVVAAFFAGVSICRLLMKP